MNLKKSPEDKDVLENPESQVQTCPNCWYDFLPDFWCKNCWYLVLNNSDFKAFNKEELIEDKYSSKNKISNIKKHFDDLVNFILKVNKFSYKNFISYKIEIFQYKVRKIYFYYNNSSFLVSIDYDLIDKEIFERDFSETCPDDRNRRYFLKGIDNLRILSIQKKVSVWYDEKKISPNYYSYLWMNSIDVYNFIKKLLNNFHKI